MEIQPARRSNISFAPEPILLRDISTFQVPVHRVGTASSDKPHSRLGRFWVRYVRITVPQQACRDHFALERTVLGYIRTSQAFAILGVTIAQFMRLQNDGDPDPRFGFFKVAVPLASICHCTAIIILLLGVTRFFRWQSTIAFGNSLSSGWEFLTTCGLSFVVLLTLFILDLVISIERSE